MRAFAQVRPSPGRAAAYRPSHGPARTHLPGRGREAPAPTAVPATSRGATSRGAAARTTTQAEGQPALGDGSRAPRRRKDGDGPAGSAGAAAILEAGSRRGRHLGVGRLASGLLPAQWFQGLEEPSTRCLRLS